ncbi:HDOD domain-containing protein [Marinobacterium sp. D7]|uniref:EAL and HDOD domain-containing protein n=1 Tax=Marinobacterium ramblicola TaxID=2849041 RepID=UPI001C2D21FE|nr:HDOD domain-containing protein [Marinobacterium ramblicola]MBV1790282.1 HDOD domain-containing protein [Marinobacterium ramblicola]
MESPTLSDTPQVLMARQPIFDRNLRVVAYELLYRSDDETKVANVLNGRHATCNVLINAYSSIVDNQTLRQLPVFLNLPRQMLETDSLPALSPKQVVFELQEELAANDVSIESIKRYKRAGYRIALDNFVYDRAFDELLDHVDIVRLDIRKLGIAKMHDQVRLLKRFGATLLAEKIETHAELEDCIALGFQLFQGYFLKHPEIVAGRRIESNETILLQLLSELLKPEPQEKRLVELIEQDPSLSYRLLSIVNSAAMSRTRKIDSLMEALVILGLTEVRKWVSLIALSGQKAKPAELTRQVLIAACMCEQLAEELKLPGISPSTAFLCGMLDRIDALLDIEKSAVLDQIAISDAMKAAIIDHEGELGQLLTRVSAFCDGFWSRIRISDHPLYHRANLEAMGWADRTLAMMG